MKLNLYACLFFAFLFSKAFGDVLIVPSSGEIKILIDPRTGSLIQLPSSVKTITPSEFFQISDVASEVDGNTGQKSDVKLFQVKPLSKNSEQVSFVLGSGRVLKTRFVPSESAEKHYDLVFPTESKSQKTFKFLSAETSLMRAMIRDEGGEFVRQNVNRTLNLSSFENLSTKQIRSFSGNGVNGYVFEVKNKSSEFAAIDVSKMTLNSEELSSEKTILLHADKDSLEPCSFLGTQGCKTKVFAVTRGENSASPLLQKKNSFELIQSKNAPFVKEQLSENSGGAR